MNKKKNSEIKYENLGLILRNDSKDNIDKKNYDNLELEIKKEQFSHKSFYYSQNKIISNIFKNVNNSMKKKKNFLIIKPEPILTSLNTPEQNFNFGIFEKKTNFEKLKKIEISKSLIFNNNSEIKKKSIYEKGFFKSQRKKRFSLKFYSQICFLISEVFRGKIPNFKIFDNLDKISKKLFFQMIIKKFENIFSSSEKNFFLKSEIINKKKFEKICEIIEQKRFSISTKRKEENMKFVFNGIIKRLKVKFFQENNIDDSLKENSKLFYEYYFKKTNNLFLFDNLSRSKKIIFNKKILKIYFISDLFKKDFIFFLRNFFSKIYLKNVYKKFEFLFKKYEKKFFTYEKSSNVIFKNLMSKNKFKFPWTFFEVEQSINAFEIFLRNISM